MCKRAPLEAEMVVEFATLSLMKSSYIGDHIYAPIPGSKAKNNSRGTYDAFLGLQRSRVDHQLHGPIAFIDWARAHIVETVPDRRDPRNPNKFEHRISDRISPGQRRTALGVSFPFELLDIYIGAWCAMFVPHRKQEELMLCVKNPHLPSGFDISRVPDGTHFLQAALFIPQFKNNVNELLNATCKDLELRGLSKDRVFTFCARLRACVLLLNAAQRGRIR